jgi:hypothetical protein
MCLQGISLTSLLMLLRRLNRYMLGKLVVLYNFRKSFKEHLPAAHFQVARVSHSQGLALMRTDHVDSNNAK